MTTSILTVSTASSTKKLAKLTILKEDLGITNSNEDTYLNRQIDRISEFVCDYLGVRAADDGSKTLGSETLVETFRLTREQPHLLLSRWPVTSITSIIEEEDDTLESDEYQVDEATGQLYRMDGDDNRLTWTACKVTVTYVAGWVLPNDSGTRTLPYPIEDAVIELVKAARSARTRDPMIRSVEVHEVQTVAYWVGATGDDDGLPQSVAAKLAPYRNINVA